MDVMEADCVVSEQHCDHARKYKTAKTLHYGSLVNPVWQNQLLWFYLAPAVEVMSKGQGQKILG